MILMSYLSYMLAEVRSHMPSALGPLLPSFCGDLIRILDSLNLSSTNVEDEYLLRLKAGKRSMQIFCALVTRHRKHFDKLMPNILTCAFKIVKQSPSVGSMGFLSERVVSLSFDFISHVLETGPGWRLVSPHFSSLLESAIFPTLVMNHKDILEWEEDADEYIRKNLPSDLEEISGWKEDSFTARKSAINLLGVISMSKEIYPIQANCELPATTCVVSSYLHSNKLTGLIPSELGNMSKLSYLQLNNNQFVGGIPPELGKLGELFELNFANNNLEGPIPRNISSCTALNQFNVHGNRLNGSIPYEFQKLESLTYLNLSSNNFKGKISVEMGRIINLDTLDLSNNDFFSPIPASVGDLEHLLQLIEEKKRSSYIF